MKKANKFFLVLFSLVTSVYLSGQSRLQEVESTQPEQTPNEPFNLPNTIIYGTQENKIASLEKRLPELEYKLADNILDSINSLEKQTPILLPLPPLPNEIPRPDDKTGYLQGSLGSFVTPRAEAGLGFSLGRFDMYLDGSVELSDGHLDEAGYSKFFARLESDYVAEDKFWIFGGSETKTTISVGNNNYNNFAADSAQNISVLDLKGDIFTDGSYEGYLFQLRGGVRSVSLISDLPDGTDFGMSGYALVEGTGDLANFGAELDLSYNTYATGDYARFSGGIAWDYFDSDFTLLNRLGATYAVPGAGDAIIWPEIRSEFNLPLGRVFTARAEARSGIEKNTFATMITHNPYLSGLSNVLFTKNIFGAGVFLRHHPVTKFGFMFGAEFDSYENYRFYSDAPESLFLASYADANIAKTMIEAYWMPTAEDNLTGNLTYFYGVSEQSEKNVPYLPDFQIEIDYTKVLFDFLSISPEISYVSRRFADILNEEEIPGYFDLRLLVDAELGNGLVLNFEARNLLDSDIYVWNGYRARGLFFSGGATWRF